MSTTRSIVPSVRLPAALASGILLALAAAAQPATPSSPVAEEKPIQGVVTVRPLATTLLAGGVEDERLTIELDAAHPLFAGLDFEFLITALPDRGFLTQADGTPIDAAPAAVTDADGRLFYFGEANDCSFDEVPVASMSYVARVAAGGPWSEPAAVAIVLAPRYDPLPQLPPVVMDEGETLLVQLPASVEGRLYLTEVFNTFCAFHQVEADNVTIGATIPSPVTPRLVTNPDRWIAIVATGNQCGNSLAFFSYVDTPDHWPLLSPYVHDRRADVNVLCVNDPPIAHSASVQCFNNELANPLDLGFTDPDGVQEPLTGVLTELPRYGRLYKDAVAAGNEVSPGVNDTFGLFDRHFVYLRDAERMWEYGYSDFLAFTVSDGELSSGEAAVEFQVVYRNLPPVVLPATTLSMPTDEDTPAWGRIVASDPDDGYLLNVIPSMLPQGGTMLLAMPQFDGGYELVAMQVGVPLSMPLGDPHTDWEIVFIPNADYHSNGLPESEFRFRVLDSQGQPALDPHLPPHLAIPGEWRVALPVFPVNDAPQILGPGSVNRPWAQPALVNWISMADDASADHVLHVNVFSSNTSFSILNLSGVNVIAQSPSAVTFEGTLSQINEVLATGIMVSAPGIPAVSRSLAVSVNDQGGSGTGGPQSSLRVFMILFE